MTSFAIIVDGTLWVDSDGNVEWEDREADTLADMLLGMGYHVVEVIPVGGCP